jgi:hypothetical protein
MVFKIMFIAVPCSVGVELPVNLRVPESGPGAGSWVAQKRRIT